MNKEEIELLNEILVSFDEYDTDWTKIGCERNAKVIRKLQYQLTQANNNIEKIKEFTKRQKEIIKKQPSESPSIDKYVLKVLDNILSIIDGSDE